MQEIQDPAKPSKSGMKDVAFISNNDAKTPVQTFIQQLRSGGKLDEKLFIKVYEQIQKWFNRYAISYNEDAYLDLIDEAITRFFERIKDFRGSTDGEFYCYMRSIIKTILDSAKSKLGRVVVSEKFEHMKDSRGHHVQDFEKNRELDDLYHCIDRLPPAFRGMIYEVLSEKPKGAIARELNLTPSMLSQHLNRAIRLLRDCLTGKGYTSLLMLG